MKKKKKTVYKKRKEEEEEEEYIPRDNIFKILNYIYTEMIELLWIFLVLQKICREKKNTFRFVNKEIIR